jgi:hypothetical protein
VVDNGYSETAAEFVFFNLLFQGYRYLWYLCCPYSCGKCSHKRFESWGEFVLLGTLNGKFRHLISCIQSKNLLHKHKRVNSRTSRPNCYFYILLKNDVIGWLEVIF